jgi:hypothetical protein
MNGSPAQLGCNLCERAAGHRGALGGQLKSSPSHAGTRRGRDGGEFSTNYFGQEVALESTGGSCLSISLFQRHAFLPKPDSDLHTHQSTAKALVDSGLHPAPCRDTKYPLNSNLLPRSWMQLLQKINPFQEALYNTSPGAFERQFGCGRVMQTAMLKGLVMVTMLASARYF